MNIISIMEESQWRELLSELFQRVGLAMSLTDPGGKILLHEGARNELCVLIREKPDTLSGICSQTNIAMLGQAKSTKAAVVDYCEAGLIRVAVPIYIDGELLGQVTGCGLMEDPDVVDAFFLSKELGIEEKQAMDLSADISKNPESSMEALKNSIDSSVETWLRNKS